MFYLFISSGIRIQASFVQGSVEKCLCYEYGKSAWHTFKRSGGRIM